MPLMGCFPLPILAASRTTLCSLRPILEALLLNQLQEFLFWGDLVENVETARKAGLQVEQSIDFSAFQNKMKSYFPSMPQGNWKL